MLHDCTVDGGHGCADTVPVNPRDESAGPEHQRESRGTNCNSSLGTRSGSSTTTRSRSTGRRRPPRFRAHLEMAEEDETPPPPELGGKRGATEPASGPVPPRAPRTRQRRSDIRNFLKSPDRATGWRPSKSRCSSSEAYLFEQVDGLGGAILQPLP